jgi:uncharacterized protein (TIGR04255 family)
VPSPSSSDGPARLKAEGFPTAPLIEAVFEVRIDGGLTAEESRSTADALSRDYPKLAESKQAEFNFDAPTVTVEVSEVRSIYRLEGKDDTEVALIRPTGLTVSQLAPYRSWETLFKRFSRDLAVFDKVLGVRTVTRLGVRFINRIDVPFDARGIAEHEEYLAGYVKLPDEISEVTDFSYRVNVDLSDIEATATIQSAVMDAAVEGKASFALDIDIVKTVGLGTSRRKLLSQLNEFRAPKNRLYRLLLTEKALKDFS